jgi:hypothetical protein
MPLKESTRALIQEMTPAERQQSLEIIAQRYPWAVVATNVKSSLQNLLNPQGLSPEQVLAEVDLVPNKLP